MLDFSNRLFGCYFSQHRVVERVRRCGIALLAGCDFCCFGSRARARSVAFARKQRNPARFRAGARSDHRRVALNAKNIAALFRVIRRGSVDCVTIRTGETAPKYKRTPRAEMKGKETERSIMIPSGSQENHPSWSNSIICLAWTLKGSSISYRPSRSAPRPLPFSPPVASRSRQLVIV